MKSKTLVGLLIIAAVSAAVLAGSHATFVRAANTASEDEIEEAIASGVDWLVSQQEDDGRWGNWEQTAVTCFALVVLEERAYKLGYDSPFDSAYPYSDNVIRGWQYIFGGPHVHVQTLSVQSHNGSADDPDTNGNGYGIYFDTAGEHQTYTTSICLMALAASGTQDRQNEGGLDYNDDETLDTFKEIAQDAADWLAFAQADSGWPEGGWDYDAQDNEGERADSSNSGYAVLGLAYGQHFDCTIPDWVRAELDVWTHYIQCVAEGDEHGGSGYEEPCDAVNELATGNLIFEMIFAGDHPNAPRFENALSYIERHWQDPDTEEGWGYDEWPADYQAMYTLMKGLEYSHIEWIDTDGDGERDDDWFEQELPALPPTDFVAVLMAHQNADGSWPQTSWEDQGLPILSTVWALLTLERAAPQPLAKALLAEADARQAIQFNPDAALQRHMFADGFVPNSPEFNIQVFGVRYYAQRAENFETGTVRVYYAKAADWDNVQFFERP
jgi:hypothetical protein